MDTVNDVIFITAGGSTFVYYYISPESVQFVKQCTGGDQLYDVHGNVVPADH